MDRPAILMIGPYPAWDMEDLDARYDTIRLWEAADKDAAIASHGQRIRAIATRGELGASAQLMASLPNLEIVSCYGVGTDAIDLAYAREKAIKVTNTPDVLTEDVADLGVALLLAAARRVPQGDAYVRSGAWSKGNMALATRLFGKRVGIAGMGRVGAALARRLAAFGCSIGYHDPVERRDLDCTYFPDLVTLARDADFLVVTMAGGEATRGIIDAAVLEALGPQGILVNISRGSTVDEAALLDALERGGILAAGLDVFHNEPNIDPRFTALDNVVLQPHVASATVETRRAMGQLVRDNLAAHFAGLPLLTPVA